MGRCRYRAGLAGHGMLNDKVKSRSLQDDGAATSAVDNAVFVAVWIAQELDDEL